MMLTKSQHILACYAWKTACDDQRQLELDNLKVARRAQYMFFLSFEMALTVFRQDLQQACRTRLWRSDGNARGPPAAGGLG